jgi:hypothetical protein
MDQGYMHERGTDRVLKDMGRVPTVPPERICPQCESHNTLGPAYPGDYSDCIDCGNSWRFDPQPEPIPPKGTPERQQFMRNIASRRDA